MTPQTWPRVRAWMMLGRLHTAAFTQGMFLSGYLLAGGEMFSQMAIIWLLYGLLFHYVGFSQNNIFHYAADVRDRNKSRHSHVTGEVSLIDAAAVNISLFIILIVLGVIIAENSAGRVLVMLAIATGTAYNYYAKRYVWRPQLCISMCFALLPGVSFYATGGDAGREIVALLFMIYVGLQVAFNNAVEGAMKDIETDRVNTLKSLGAEVRGNKFFSTKYVHGFSAAIKMPTLVILLALMSLSGTDIVIGGMAFLLLFWTAVVAAKLVKSRTWDRERSMRAAVLHQITALYALLLGVSGIIGVLTVHIVMMYLIIFYVAMNRLLWGTIMTPRV